MQFKTSLRLAALLLAAAGAVRAAQVRPLSEGERAAVQTSAAYLSRGAKPLRTTGAVVAASEAAEGRRACRDRNAPRPSGRCHVRAADGRSRAQGRHRRVHDQLSLRHRRDGRIRDDAGQQDREPAHPGRASLNAPPFPPEKATDTTAAEPENGPSHVPLFLGMLAAFLGIVAASILKLNAAARSRSWRLRAPRRRRRMARLARRSTPRGCTKGRDGHGGKDLSRIGSAASAPAHSGGRRRRRRRRLPSGGHRRLRQRRRRRCGRRKYDLQQMKLPEVERALKGLSLAFVDAPRGDPARACGVRAGEGDRHRRGVRAGHRPRSGTRRLVDGGGQALDTLGFDDRAHGYLTRLINIGSRDANVYYSAAVLAAAHDREDERGEDAPAGLGPSGRPSARR